MAEIELARMIATAEPLKFKTAFPSPEEIVLKSPSKGPAGDAQVITEKFDSSTETSSNATEMLLNVEFFNASEERAGKVVVSGGWPHAFGAEARPFSPRILFPGAFVLRVRLPG
jgi:hypothetical protein